VNSTHLKGKCNLRLPSTMAQPHPPPCRKPRKSRGRSLGSIAAASTWYWRSPRHSTARYQFPERHERAHFWLRFDLIRFIFSISKSGLLDPLTSISRTDSNSRRLALSNASFAQAFCTRSSHVCGNASACPQSQYTTSPEALRYKQFFVGQQNIQPTTKDQSMVVMWSSRSAQAVLTRHKTVPMIW
jgi:hypothetical protein